MSKDRFFMNDETAEWVEKAEGDFEVLSDTAAKSFPKNNRSHLLCDPAVCRKVSEGLSRRE